MKLMSIALTAALLSSPSVGHAQRCEVESEKIIEEIGAIQASGDDEIDAQAAATETCMDRYQTKKHLSQDDAFDLCVNQIKCKKASKTL